MRRTRGFTLIELLLVIMIAALLVSLLFPVVAGAWRTLRRRHCQVNLKNVHGVFAAYAGANRGVLPGLGMSSIYESQHTAPMGTPANRHLMLEELMRHGATPEIFCCPLHPRFKDIEDSDFYGWKLPNWRTAGSNSWQKYYSTPGYAFFAYIVHHGRHPTSGSIMPNRWATWSRFTAGRFLPRLMSDPGNPPLAADVMMVDSAYNGFWHDSLRESMSGSEYDERCLMPGGGGHTLFLAGDVVWFEWGELEAQGAGYESNNDHYYYFGMEKPGE